MIIFALHHQCSALILASDSKFILRGEVLQSVPINCGFYKMRYNFFMGYQSMKKQKLKELLNRQK